MGEDIEKSRLAAAGGPHQGDQLACLVSWTIIGNKVQHTLLNTPVHIIDQIPCLLRLAVLDGDSQPGPGEVLDGVIFEELIVIFLQISTAGATVWNGAAVHVEIWVSIQTCRILT